MRIEGRKKRKAKVNEMNTKIRIGTRSSDLSVAQTMLVIKAIQERFPGTEAEIVCRKTVGDKILDKPLQAFGGKGVFVSEFEEALLNGEIDFAVHSAKDLPLELADGLEIVGALSRGDVRDVLVTLNGSDGEIRGNEPGSETVIIGTSSLRRKIQIEELAGNLWPGKSVVCKILRGNVLTRLKRLEQGDYDAVILAAAGLSRLGILEEKKDVYHFHYLSEEEMIPAAGQGILVAEGRKGEEKNRFVREISDPEAMRQLWMERRVLSLLHAGCHEPVGVYGRADPEKSELCLTGIYEKDGKRRRAEVRKQIVQAGKEAIQAGKEAFGLEKAQYKNHTQKMNDEIRVLQEMEEAAWEMACELVGGEENLPGRETKKKRSDNDKGGGGDE